MEENKDIKDEDIIVENEPVIEDTDNVDKAEAAEAEEIVEEYSENDDLSLIRKMKDENKKLSNEVEALKEIHITGIVKTSKKVTLVVGEMAAKYAQFIQEEIKNQEV